MAKPTRAERPWHLRMPEIWALLGLDPQIARPPGIQGAFTAGDGAALRRGFRNLSKIRPTAASDL